jgi:hypothetical protein
MVIIFYSFRMQDMPYLKGFGNLEFGLRKVRVSSNETLTLGYGKSESLKSTKNGQSWLPE